jgi:hypothetical protein
MNQDGMEPSRLTRRRPGLTKVSDLFAVAMKYERTIRPTLHVGSVHDFEQPRESGRSGPCLFLLIAGGDVQPCRRDPRRATLEALISPRLYSER